MEQARKADLLANPRHPYTRVLLATTPSVDPAHRQVAVTVMGELPSPLNPPPGYVFASRCPYAQPRCSAERPDLRPVDNHLDSCHFADR